MGNEFFPYKYRENGLEMQLARVAIDNKLVPLNATAVATKVVDLADNQGWKVLEVSVQVQIHPDTIRAVLPEGELTAGTWHAVLVARSIAPNSRQIVWRQSERLSPSQEADLTWTGNLRITSDDAGSTIRLRTYLTRLGRAPAPKVGFADEPGLRLSSSEEWLIQIDPASDSSGKSMKIDWIDFKACDKSMLNQIPDALYFLDLDQDLPILYLNEGIPDLKIVLNGQGYVGPRAAMRDAIFHSIAQPVWVALVVSCVSRASTEEGDLTEWQASVLHEIAPFAYKDTDEDTAIKEIMKDGSAPDKSVFMQRLLPAIQTYLDLRKSSMRLLETLKR